MDPPLTDGVPLAYTFSRLNDLPTSDTSTVTSPSLLVFINGLMLPRASWTPTISNLNTALSSQSTPTFYLTYDRYGQGESRSSDPSWKPKLHDVASAATELETVLQYTLSTYKDDLTATPTLIFISHSIGVPLARLHNHTTATPAAAHLFLDSNIANTDFVSLLPDPERPAFDAERDIPEGVSVEVLQGMRERTKKMFHPTVPNPEGLDRSNLAELLPDAGKPLLRGPNEVPFLTVVGHDPEAFAQEGLKMMGSPVELNNRFIQPGWDKYNEGLLALVGEDKRKKGVVIAKGAGHFVQKDNPMCVADEVMDLIRSLSAK